MADGGQAQERRDKQKKGPSLLEWAAGALGALIAIGLVTFIALEALDSAPGKPPLLVVQPTEIVSEQGQHVVEVKVANRSGQTAATVEIEGELKQGGTTIETSNATISYVPGHSERQAGLIFTRDPRRHDFEVRAIGYAKP